MNRVCKSEKKQLLLIRHVLATVTIYFCSVATGSYIPPFLEYSSLNTKLENKRNRRLLNKCQLSHAVFTIESLEIRLAFSLTAVVWSVMGYVSVVDFGCLLFLPNCWCSLCYHVYLLQHLHKPLLYLTWTTLAILVVPLVLSVL